MVPNDRGTQTLRKHKLERERERERLRVLNSNALRIVGIVQILKMNLRLDTAICLAVPPLHSNFTGPVKVIVVWFRLIIWHSFSAVHPGR